MTIRRRLAGEDLAPKEREILARRAERLRAPVANAVEGPVEWFAEFPVGAERFAISVGTLRAVVPLRRVTPVPLSEPHVIGIVRFHSQIITALSIASLLGVRGWRQDPSVLLVVDPGWGRLLAVDCEDVPRPISIDKAVVEEARRGAAHSIADLLHGGRVVHLVDLARLLDRRTGARVGG